MIEFARAGDRSMVASSPISAMKQLLSTCILLASVACGSGQAAETESAHADSAARARQDSINRAQPGYIVDSILTIEEHLRRFRADLADTLRHFQHAAPSREALVDSFVRSLESADTASLIQLTISRAEFAWLVYPDSPLIRPPYRQAPDLVWLRHSASSSSGLARLMSRLGGARLGYESVKCETTPAMEGDNRIWRECVISFAPPDESPRSLRLFAGIIERHGRFKIHSYANAF